MEKNKDYNIHKKETELNFKKIRSFILDVIIELIVVSLTSESPFYKFWTNKQGTKSLLQRY